MISDQQHRVEISFDDGVYIKLIKDLERELGLQ